MGDILLQGDGDLRIQHARIWAVVVRVRNVFAVKRRRDREEVGIRVVSESFVEEKRVASENAKAFSDSGAVLSRDTTTYDSEIVAAARAI